jgi:outer membrane protein assembly factor BamB
MFKRARLQGALGAYYASPVGADGKIYAVSEEGNVSVVRAGTQWELLAVNRLDEGSQSTPAIVGDTLFVRTYDALYSFREKR